MIEVTAEQRAELVRLTRGPSVAAGLARRARIVLLAAEGEPLGRIARRVGVDRNTVRTWLDRFRAQGLAGLRDLPRPGRPPLFVLAVALYLVRLACDLPDRRGRSLSLWDCTELARQVVRDGIVETISPQTVQRLLAARRLKPWRCHYWLHPKAPRDAAFVERVREIAALTTRALPSTEVVLSVDEMTSLQPRPRIVPTRPAQPGRAVQLEHAYQRKGAAHLFAAFDIQSGQVFGRCCRRKRQVEFISLLEHLDQQIAPSITTMHLIGDNVSVHRGKLVQAWLTTHPRFVLHFTPVHCSWINQIEQWFSILRRKRLRAPNFADVPALIGKIAQFIAEWNETAHPFAWTAKSFEKILAKAEAALPEATLPEVA